MNEQLLQQSARLIYQSRYTVAFVGAGISVNSGLPLFSQWVNFNPQILDINFFYQNPQHVWKQFNHFFYSTYLSARPNEVHHLLKEMQNRHWLRSVVTLNIDDLLQKANLKNVHNVCGMVKQVVCTNCAQKFSVTTLDFSAVPPKCPHCGGLLKPDIQFYGDAVPDPDYKLGLKEINRAKLLVIVGTSGSMMPAGVMPMFAKRRKKIPIIEINIQPTIYTAEISDIFIPLPAQEALKYLLNELRSLSKEEASF